MSTARRHLKSPQSLSGISARPTMVKLVNIISYPGNDMRMIIKKAVWKHEFESWVASQFMYPELDCYYKGVKNISMHCRWRYTAKNPRMTTPVSSVVSVMMGSHPKSLQCNFYKQTCSLCYGQLRDNAIHVIYECPELEYTRSDAWTKVLASMPSAMANQIDTFSTQKQTFVHPICTPRPIRQRVGWYL